MGNAGLAPGDVFVGREDELSALRRWRSRSRPPGEVFLIEGEAGVGKSSLAREFTAGIPRSHLVMVAVPPNGRDEPFGALFAGLGLPTEAGGQRRRSSAAEAHPDTCHRLRESILDCLSSRASHHPLLLVVDDAQWLDDGSLSTLVAATDLTTGFAIDVLVLRRTNEPEPERFEVLSAAAVNSGAPMRLGELAASEVAELATLRLNGAPGPRLLAALAGAGGNPLFVGEILDSLERRGMLVSAGGVSEVAAGWNDLPDAPDTAPDRLAGLSGAARVVARYGSVIGRTFRPADVRPLLGWPALKVAVACRELISARVVLGDGELLRFRHDVLREAIYEDLPPWERQTVHSQVAGELVRAGGEPLAVARHLERAGSGDSIQPWFERAGVRLLEADPMAASKLLRRAMELSAAPGPDLLVAMAQSLVWTNRAEEALDLISGCDDRPMGLVLVAAQAHAARGDLARAADEFEAAAESSGTPVLAQRARGEAQLLRALGFEHERALTQARQLTSEDTVDPLAAVHAECAISWAEKNRGRMDESIAAARRGIALAGSDPALLWRNPHMFLADAYLAADRLEEFEVAAREARSVALAHGDIWQIPSLSSMWAGAGMRMGEWDKAVAEAEAGIGWARETGNHLALPWLLSIQAAIAIWRGSCEAAAALLDEAEDELAGHYRSGAEAVLWARGVAAEAAGDLTAAAEVNVLLWKLVRESGVTMRQPMLAPHVVRSVVAVGSHAVAEEVAGDLDAMASSFDGDVPIRGYQAARIWVEGLVTGSADLIAGAGEILGGIGLKVDQVVAGVDAVEVAADSGDTAVAERLAPPVAERTDRLGAAGIRRRLDRTVLVAPQPPEAGESVLHRLSRAERRVAELVATGASNPEIAERLHVSRRTVESHLSHIFTKLDLCSRVELAVLVVAGP